MSMTTEVIVGEHAIDGRLLHVVQVTWRSKPGVSYDIADADTGEPLTVMESFGHYPDAGEIREVLNEPEA